MISYKELIEKALNELNLDISGPLVYNNINLIDLIHDKKRITSLGHQLLDILFPTIVQAESTINPIKSKRKPLDTDKINLIKGNISLFY